MVTILVRGSGDVGSAVAHALFTSGYSVIIHDLPRPSHSRRSMAFTDALFEGNAELEGVLAKRIKTAGSLPFMLRCHRAIPVAAEEIGKIISTVQPHVVVDARMRKRSIPETQRELACLTIGLGPNFTAGENVDIAVETSWGDELGRVVHRGPTKDLGGEPSELGGRRRERFVYSTATGVFCTQSAIGGLVEAGDVIGTAGETPIRAPLTGRLRGLTHNNAMVEVGTKLVEIDPREDSEIARGLGDRPRRIAEGVLKAIRDTFAL